jgi:NAD(P)H-dependent FMN reductase
MLKLMIIVASTRPGRVGLPIAHWFEEQARKHGGFEIDWCDLEELALPFVDEPEHPRFRRYQNQHTRDWSARVDWMDAFVMVTPEYNHGMSAPLKNALDYLNAEWFYKPVGFVSYGGVSGGTRAVEMIKTVVTTLKMMPMFETVSISFVGRQVKDGEFQTSDVQEAAAATMLDELAKWATALQPLHAGVPEGSAT